MRLEDEQESKNIEDRRGQGGGFGFPGGFPIPMGGRRGGGIGIGGLIILMIMMFVFGINPLEMLGQMGGPPVPPKSQEERMPRVPPQGEGRGQPAEDEGRRFVAKVLNNTEDTWQKVFAAANRRYEEPRLVLFERFVQSACGSAQSAMGPFYCPLDRKVYIDLSFFREMKVKLGAGGDFAQAYVIAHEVGHHVQNLLGIAERVTEARQQLPEAEANQLSVRMELQADCFAGLWAKRNPQILEQGDIEEGLNAASAIGDDRLQKRGQGYVVPESFTHGSSAQRVRWFRRGFDSGEMRSCDTFKADAL